MNSFRKIAQELRSSSVKITDIDRERATKLRKYVSSKHWYVSHSPTRWARAFGILRRRLDEDHNMIDLVLDFIVTKKLSKPKIRDGRDLMDRWNWVVDLIESKAEDPAEVEITDEAKRIVGYVQDMGWPTQAKKLLPVVAQLSLNVTRPFFQEVHKRAIEYAKPIPVKYDPKKHAVKYKHRKMVKVHPLMHRYEQLVCLMLRPEAFVTRYLRWLNNRAQNWPDFSWTMQAMAFKLDSGMGAVFGRSFDYWDEIVKEVQT